MYSQFNIMACYIIFLGDSVEDGVLICSKILQGLSQTEFTIPSMKRKFCYCLIGSNLRECATLQCPLLHLCPIFILIVDLGASIEHALHISQYGKVLSKGFKNLNTQYCHVKYRSLDVISLTG